MSDVTQTVAAPGAAKTWFLKTDDGSIFGPAKLPDLRSWAEEGRITPGSEVSEDRTLWIPAEKLTDLEMFWMVELTDGTSYGPVNLKALADLVQDGTIEPRCRLINQTTGETSTIEQRLDAKGAPLPMHETVSLDRIMSTVTDQAKEAVRPVVPDPVLVEPVYQPRPVSIPTPVSVVRPVVPISSPREPIATMDATDANIRTAAHENAKLEREVGDARRQVDDLAHNLKQAQVDLQRQRDENERRVSASLQKEQQLEQNLASLRDEVSRSRRELQENREIAAASTKPQDDMRVRDMESHISSLEDQLRQTEQRLQEQHARLSEAVSGGHGREQELLNEVERLRQDLTDRSGRFDALRIELSRHTDMFQQLQEQARIREQELQRQIEEVSRSKHEALREAQTQLDKERQQITDLSLRHKTFQTEVSDKVRTLQERLQQVTGELDRSRHSFETEKSRAELLEQQSRSKRDEHDRLMTQFKQSLVGETRKIEKELEKDREFFESVRAAILKKEQWSKDRIKNLRDTISADWSTVEAEFQRREEALKKVNTVGPELDHVRSDYEELQRRHQKMEESLTRRVQELEGERKLAATRLIQTESTIEQQKILIDDLKSRSQKSDSELSRRMDELQDEAAGLMRRLHEGQLHLEEMTKFRDDAVAQRHRVEEELRHALSVAQQTGAEAHSEASELQKRVHELESLYEAATGKLDQMVWETRQKDSTHLVELDEAEKLRRKLEEEEALLRHALLTEQTTAKGLRLQIERMQAELGQSDRQAQDRVAEFDRHLDQIQRERQALEEQYRKVVGDLEHERSLRLTQERDTTETHQVLSRQIDDLNSAVDAARSERRHIEEELRKSADAAEALKDKLAKKQEEHEERVERMRRDYQELAGKMDGESSRLDETRAALRQKELEVSDLARRLESQQAQIARRDAEFQHAQQDAQDRQKQMVATLEQVEQQAASQRALVAQKTEELEKTQRRIDEMDAVRKHLESELAQSRRQGEEEKTRSAQRDEQSQQRKRQLDEETARRKQLEDQVTDLERRAKDAEDRKVQLEQELSQERGFLQDAQSRMQEEQDSQLERMNRLQDEYRDLVLKFDELQQDFEQQRMLYEDERIRSQQAEDELTLRSEQMSREHALVRAELDRTVQDLERQKIGSEDEKDRSRLKIESLEQETDQLEQERSALTVRLDQQKKFYDEEREQRRNREMELLEQKKAFQDVSSTLRQRDQALSQLKKAYEDDMSRAKQREQMLSRRLEQLQGEWRAAGVAEPRPPVSKEIKDVASAPAKPRVASVEEPKPILNWPPKEALKTPRFPSPRAEEPVARVVEERVEPGPSVAPVAAQAAPAEPEKETVVAADPPSTKSVPDTLRNLQEKAKATVAEVAAPVKPESSKERKETDIPPQPKISFNKRRPWIKLR